MKNRVIYKQQEIITCDIIMTRIVKEYSRIHDEKFKYCFEG